jgi:hypothetical protein
MGIFDLTQHVILRSGGLIYAETYTRLGTGVNLQSQLITMSIGELLFLVIQTTIINILAKVLSIIIFVIIYGRLVEIYILTSLAPLPMATLMNREMSGIGHNYIKSLLAVGFQGFLMMVCVGIYAVLIQSIGTSGDPINAMWTAIGFTILLCFTLFKTGSVSKAIFGAH